MTTPNLAHCSFVAVCSGLTCLRKDWLLGSSSSEDAWWGRWQPSLTATMISRSLVTVRRCCALPPRGYSRHSSRAPLFARRDPGASPAYSSFRIVNHALLGRPTMCGAGYSAAGSPATASITGRFHEQEKQLGDKRMRDTGFRQTRTIIMGSLAI